MSYARPNKAVEMADANPPELVDTSKAALALLELGKGCTIEGHGIDESLPPCQSLFDTESSDRERLHLAFESARPQDIVSKALFHKFRSDRTILKRYLAISLMVISYLDDTWERIMKSNSENQFTLHS